MANLYDRSAFERAALFATELHEIENRYNVALYATTGDLAFTDLATGARFELGDQAETGYTRSLGAM